mmetsp:Transcript_26447/g.57964  ORF Transcript_26447/g.57964 Transcript_26447/m.57964 type:complete len:383 (-) Transcript_26447:131-1279(-)
MPLPADLRELLKLSGHWEDYKIQASKGGSGRLDWSDPEHEDPRKWIPIMMSPALGNPNGNTLQEFFYQNRCINMIGRHETDKRGEVRYERVVFPRLEMEWLHDHPPVGLLESRYLWIPTGDDNTGINDRHWVANRRDAEAVFRRWDALVGDEFIKIFFPSSKVRPAFISSEIYMKLYLQYHHVAVARFPNLGALQCCDANYAPASRLLARQRDHCFAQDCMRLPCPSSLAHTDACAAPRDGANQQSPHRDLSFKYFDEGRSAIINALALSIPGAKLEFAEDRLPPRLHIRLPTFPGQSGPSLMYFCKTCETAPVVSRIAVNSSGCLFNRQVYVSPILESARRKHNCRYYDKISLAYVCGKLPRKAREEFYWWCDEALRLKST